MFAVLLYNNWRLTKYLLKADVDGPMDYEPVVTAGKWVEIVVSALISPDYWTEPHWVLSPGVERLVNTPKIQVLSHTLPIYTSKSVHPPGET